MKKIVLLCSLWIGSLHAQDKPYRLVWEEHFDRPVLDTAVWNFDEGNGCPQLCGWGNNERQTYTRTNHRIEKSCLVIEARREADGYSSTRIHTAGKKTYLYGKIEARLQLPQGQGVWPAFWMLGASLPQVGWPRCGEIDIMEYTGKAPGVIHTTMHNPDSYGQSKHTQQSQVAQLEQGFHTYAIEWTPQAVDFFIDQKKVYTYAPEVKTADNWPYDKPFYLLLNLAIGGGFGGPEVNDAIFPQTYCIDYVRVYQRN